MKLSLKKLYVFIFILLTLAVPAFSYSVRDILIEGNVRTKDRTIRILSGLKPGDSVTEEDLDKVAQNLLKSEIFRNDLSVDLVPVSETEADVRITLRDRWTLIPLPVAYVSSDSWLAGGVFIESNALGLNQSVVTGTFVSDDVFQGFFSWSNPAFFQSSYSFGVSGSWYFGARELLDKTGDEILGDSDEREFSARLKGGRTYDNDLFWEVSSGLEMISRDDKSFTPWLQNSLEAGWSDLYYISFFNRGWEATGKTTVFTAHETDIQLEGALSRNFIMRDRHLLRFLVSGGAYDGSADHVLLIGGGEGSRALPSGDIAAEKYVSSMLSVEPVIASPSWGIFTLPVYFEGGWFSSSFSGESDEIWYGPGLGFRFYVDQVAIPALGADFTWDLDSGSFKVAVSLGGSMN